MSDKQKEILGLARAILADMEKLEETLDEGFMNGSSQYRGYRFPPGIISHTV